MRGGIVVACACVVWLGCASSDTTSRANDDAERANVSAVQQAALTELFLVRERASALLLWRDTAHTGPILDSLGLIAAGEIAPPANIAAARVSLAEVEALFAQHPDGWAALYATYPGIPGLVEVGPVSFGADARTAQIIVGRSCGENCRMAWQVTLEPQDEQAWRVRKVGPVPPR